MLRAMCCYVIRFLWCLEIWWQGASWSGIDTHWALHKELKGGNVSTVLSVVYRKETQILG